MFSNFIRLLIAGFTAGWGPCLACAAPLLLPYIGATKKDWKGGFKVGLMFSIGRLLALAIMGGVATVAFSFINRFFSPQKFNWLYFIVALFMITTGILIISGKRLLKINIGRKILDKSAANNMFLFGFLIGIAPCGPYIAILTYIACIAEGIVFKGILYAVMFAAGTAVALLILSTLMGVIPGKLFKSDKLHKGFQVVCGLILIFFGLQLIYSIFNLAIF